MVHQYLTTTHCRRNAGNLLRLISDDFNERKFPELVAPFKTRSQSLPTFLGIGGGVRRWRAAGNAFVFLRRMGQSTFGSRPAAEQTPRDQGDVPNP